MIQSPELYMLSMAMFNSCGTFSSCFPVSSSDSSIIVRPWHPGTQAIRWMRNRKPPVDRWFIHVKIPFFIGLKNHPLGEEGFRNHRQVGKVGFI